MDDGERIVLPHLFGPHAALASLPWQPFRAGIEIVRLYGDGAHGPAAALLRYAPGARLPEHVHVATEHILIVRGEQHDEHGRYPEGTLLVSGPGTSHRVASDDGCVALAVWNEPVQFTEA